MSGTMPPTWTITGASSGLGRALAKGVTARGWNAVLTARDPAALDDIGSDRPNVLRIALDVTRKGDPAGPTEQAIGRFGQIDALVNSAGYGYVAPVEEGDLFEVERMFAINVFGALAVIRAVLPSMRGPARRRDHQHFLVGRSDGGGWLRILRGVEIRPGGDLRSAPRRTSSTPGGLLNQERGLKPPPVEVPDGRLRPSRSRAKKALSLLSPGSRPTATGPTGSGASGRPRRASKAGRRPWPPRAHPSVAAGFFRGLRRRSAARHGRRTRCRRACERTNREEGSRHDDHASPKRAPGLHIGDIGVIGRTPRHRVVRRNQRARYERALAPDRSAGVAVGALAQHHHARQF